MSKEEVYIQYIDSIEAVAIIPVSLKEEFIPNKREISSLIPARSLKDAFLKKYEEYIHPVGENEYLKISALASYIDEATQTLVEDDDVSIYVVPYLKRLFVISKKNHDFFMEELNELDRYKDDPDRYKEKVKEMRQVFRAVSKPLTEGLENGDGVIYEYIF